MNWNWIQYGLLDLDGNGWPWETVGDKILFVFLAIVFAVAVPYLLGSINTAVLFSRILYREDIRTKGSGNAGLTNMHRVYGAKAAALVLVGDMLKMILSLFIVGLVFGMNYVICKADPTGAGPMVFPSLTFATNPFLYLAGLCCILGHIFPVYFKFKGGKGVLCTVAFLLVVSPLVFLVCFGVIWILMLLITRYVSVASMSVGLLYPMILHGMQVILKLQPNGINTLLALIIGLLIIYCHRSNIIRLAEKRENKFHFRKKKKDDQDK